MLLALLLLATPRCFDVAAEDNTAATNKVFEARQCQGGGVTWAALVHVVAKRAGAPKASYSVDDEGDAAQVCSKDAALLKKLREGLKRLNQSADELRKAMTETSARELECSATARE
jgi:hypothetical protein